ncbi:MAG: triose-phosphate isomerase [Gammaproteobacteria bacterium]|nr:triose-phosphate isomerase [Gammaproteobacteria bacterium]MCP5201320.1 triose-phosphate isomerase [Gammaproteobacteria bacterium]
MRRPLVAGNWKMNGSSAMADDLTAAVTAAAPPAVEVLLCPPAPYLARVAAALAGSAVALGAQDCSEHAPGAYTGEVAGAMLRDCGCSHTLVGHSERRQFFGDTDARVAAKVARAQADGLVAVLCVGETLEERRAGRTEEAVGRQLDAVLALPDTGAVLDALVVAYEPVWAIGTGETATPGQAQAVHAWIRARVAERDAARAAALRILYGGSVKPDNAAELFAMADIDGGLIGGAALKADSFLAICAAAAATAA